MAHAHTHACIPSQPDANGALAPVPGYLTEQIHHVLRHHQDDPIPSVEVIEYAELIDSCDMGPLQWRQVAQDIHKHYEVFDGFVVIMGTDTLAYTASALSFMFENLGKTVIITGSQVPIARINSDARRNLLFGQQLPPPGALYVGHMKLPILGQQTFMLRIVSRTKAKITLHGAMNLDEYGEYVVERSSSGEVSLHVDFNEPTLALLNRFKTRIRHVKYFDEDDYAELTIAPLILPTFRVRLHRTLAERREIARPHSESAVPRAWQAAHALHGPAARLSFPPQRHDGRPI